jgi:drug/metabolite transporter (DMT)-like permease
MTLAPPAPIKHVTALGVLCGAGSALFWSFGFVAARHGILVGLSPLILSLHRFVWPGVILLPLIARGGFRDLGGVGWRHGILLTAFGGLPLALWSYSGYLFVPLGHGVIIQPSCAAVVGIVLARIVLGEALPWRRVVGAATIVAGLCVIGVEALHTMGAQGVTGDLLFAAAGISFAVFGILLGRFRVAPMRAAAVTSMLSLVGLPLLYFGYASMIAVGFWENLMQAVVQGLFAGAGGIYLFTRAVELLGASRASVYPSLVPVFALVVGAVTVGELPSLWQLVGLAIVLIGFRLTQKS